MAIVLTVLRKLIFGTVVKAALNHILNNEKLQKEVFFWLAHIIVKRTDTPADDEFLAMVEKAMGETPDLKGLPV